MPMTSTADFAKAHSFWNADALHVTGKPVAGQRDFIEREAKALLGERDSEEASVQILWYSIEIKREDRTRHTARPFCPPRTDPPRALRDAVGGVERFHRRDLPLDPLSHALA